jgi:hypothetical protein
MARGSSGTRPLTAARHTRAGRQIGLLLYGGRHSASKRSCVCGTLVRITRRALDVRSSLLTYVIALSLDSARVDTLSLTGCTDVHEKPM